MDEFDPIGQIDRITSLLWVIERQSEDVRRGVGYVVWKGTLGPQIVPTLEEIATQLRDLQGRIVEHEIQRADETRQHMHNACLAGVAIADPSTAPDLIPFSYPLEDIEE